MTRLRIPGTIFSTFVAIMLTLCLSIVIPTADAGQSSSKKQHQSIKHTIRTSKALIVKKTHTVSKIKSPVRTSKTVVLRKKNTTCKTTRHRAKLQPSSVTKTAVASRGNAKRKKSLPANIKGGSFSKIISAKSAIIIDARSGVTLFAKSPDNPRQPASTIKILTGMIALKSLTGAEQVPVSSWAAGQPSSKVNLNTNKQYQANDLINAVLIASANDASVALAEKIAGSESSFAKMMTERAKLWGAQNTVCKTASGLTAKGQTSTARDLAVMFRHAMEDPAFAARMKQVKVTTTYGATLRNHNKALWQVEGTQGGKTGFTNAARQTYVGKFKRGNREIVVAVMGSETMWVDVKNLVQRGFTLQIPNSTALKTSLIEGQGLLTQTSNERPPGLQD